MPNHVKNRVIVIGDADKVKAFIEKFSTSYERTPSLSYDGSHIYKNANGNYGWLDLDTNQFTRRNEVAVTGVPEGYEQDFEEAWTRFPDFNKIVPQPEGMDIEVHSGIESAVKKHLGLPHIRGGNRSDLDEKDQLIFDQAVKNYEEHGHIYWYDWRNTYWGTKWNAYSCNQVNENTFEFDTAWSSVPHMIEEMSLQYPDVAIEYKWSDENTGYNCGTAAYKNGEVDFEVLDNGSNEAYELAFELRPSCKEYYKMIDGRYQYNED